MRKTAVYAGTRNVYPCMGAAAKSLLRECRGKIDRVYFLTEDDAFPEELPDVIRVINVKDKFTQPGTVNYENPWTYMTMARLALHRILPDEARVLYLDVDTIAMTNMIELFDVDLGGNLIGGVREPKRCLDPFVYVNAGVLLMDLEKLRGGFGDEMLAIANRKKLKCPDQDAINLICQGRIQELNPIYNASDWTQLPMNAKIYHYAGVRNYTEYKLFKNYMNMKWGDIYAREI